MHLFTQNIGIERDELNVSINKLVDVVVMNKLIVQVSLSDVFAFFDRIEHDFNDFNQACDWTDSIQV